MKVQNRDTGEVREYYGTIEEVNEEERGVTTFHLTTTEEGNMEKVEDSEFKESFRPYKGV